MGEADDSDDGHGSEDDGGDGEWLKQAMVASLIDILKDVGQGETAEVDLMVGGLKGGLDLILLEVEFLGSPGPFEMLGLDFELGGGVSNDGVGLEAGGAGVGQVNGPDARFQLDVPAFLVAALNRDGQVDGGVDQEVVVPEAEDGFSDGADLDGAVSDDTVVVLIVERSKTGSVDVAVHHSVSRAKVEVIDLLAVEQIGVFQMEGQSIGIGSEIDVLS